MPGLAACCLRETRIGSSSVCVCVWCGKGRSSEYVCRVVCKHLRASQRHAMFCSCWVWKQAWWLSNQRGGSESRQGGERRRMRCLLARLVGDCGKPGQESWTKARLQPQRMWGWVSSWGSGRQADLKGGVTSRSDGHPFFLRLLASRLFGWLRCKGLGETRRQVEKIYWV